MQPKKIDHSQATFFSTFEEQLNHQYPLYRLAQKIDWQLFEDAFTPLYSSTKGRPAKSIRRMVGLLILKHLRNVSDESVVEQWSDNANRTAFIDTTVQEKNITYPTDAKLHRKIIKKCQQIAHSEGLEVRQTYTRTLKKLGVDQRFRKHPKSYKKARKADAKVRTIAGRLMRELERLLGEGNNNYLYTH